MHTLLESKSAIKWFQKCSLSFVQIDGIDKLISSKGNEFHSRGSRLKKKCP